MIKSSGFFCFSTSNYDEMKKFLSDFGFLVVEDSRGQLVPLFGDGRGATVKRGDLFFNLEECTAGNQKTPFNLVLTDYADEEIQRIKSLGYEYKYGASSLYGECHAFRTPDGGTFALS